jgi:Tol biopolymer transport system component
MTPRPGRGNRVLAAATAAALVAVLAGSALAGPLPPPPATPGAPAALPPGSAETPGSNELISAPQQERGAVSATAAATADDLFGPPTIAANGRFVVFLQELGPGENRVAVRDRRERTTTVVDGPDSNGPLQHPTISADGRWIAYTRSIDGPDPTEVVLVDRASRDEVAIPPLPRAYFFPDQPTLSADGRFLAVRARGTETTEILLLDRTAGAWEVVSVDVNNRPIGSRTGDAAQPAVSGDGRVVAFSAGSARIQLVEGVKPTATRQVYLRDRAAGRTALVSRTAGGQASDGPALTPAVSTDGAVVAFASAATDLVPGIGEGDVHVYAWTAATGAVELVSRSADGVPGNDASAFPAVTADGSGVAFASAATNLVPGDTTGGSTAAQPGVAFVARGQLFIAGDVFVRDRGRSRTTRISVARGNDAEANGLSTYPSMSATGQFVAFTSVATNLVATDRNETAPDVFVRVRPPRIAAAPNPVDFGASLVGSFGVTRPVTIRSTGVTAARVGDITVGGRDAGDFFVSANPCTGRTLEPGATCEVEVLFIGTANGERVGTLRVASDAGDPVALRLTGTVGRPRLEVDPERGPPGTVVIATGSGFPAFAPITLEWSVGITADPLVPVVTDENGSFVTQVLVLPRDREGERRLRATASVPGVTLAPVTDRFFVTRPTAAPPTSGLIQVFTVTPGEPIILRR